MNCINCGAQTTKNGCNYCGDIKYRKKKTATAITADGPDFKLIAAFMSLLLTLATALYHHKLNLKNIENRHDIRIIEGNTRMQKLELLMKSISDATCDYCGRHSVEIQCVTCGGDTPSNMIYHTTRASDTAMSVAEIYKVNSD